MAHVLQALTELDPETTITSIDGISAFDTMSRKAMLEGLERVVGGSAVLPFVRLFYFSPSAYLWEDEDGEVHTIHQGEGGEQGDALMPLLFCVGQHAALEAIQRGMSPNEKLLAFLDDLYIFQARESGDIAQCCRTRVVGPLQDPGPWGQDARVELSWSETRGVQQVAESGRSS